MASLVPPSCLITFIDAKASAHGLDTVRSQTPGATVAPTPRRSVAPQPRFRVSTATYSKVISCCDDWSFTHSITVASRVIRGDLSIGRRASSDTRPGSTLATTPAMAKTPHWTTADVSVILEAAGRYAMRVPDDVMTELDGFRLQTLPEVIQQRRIVIGNGGDEGTSGKNTAAAESRKNDPEGAYITKDELVKLVDWKLCVDVNYLPPFLIHARPVLRYAVML